MMVSLLSRMYRAARFDATVYEELGQDKRALVQALIVVLLSSFAAGLGQFGRGGGIGWILGQTVFALAGWLIWAVSIYLVGVKWLPEKQERNNFSSVLRDVGFASSPGVIRILALTPGAAALLYPLSMIWIMAAMVVATKYSFKYTQMRRAALVCFLGWVLQMGVVFGLAILSVMLTPGEAG